MGSHSSVRSAALLPSLLAACEPPGVSFDDDDALHVLDAQVVKDLFAKRALRTRCLFSATSTAAPVDLADHPLLEQLRCYSPEEYGAIFGDR